MTADDETRASRAFLEFSRAEQRMWLIYIRVLLRISYEMNREFQIDSGISLADYHVLNALWGAPGRRMQITALATRIGWERSRASHQVRRMSQRALVSTATAAADRRATEVSLTPHGAEVYEDSSVGHMQLVRRLFVDAVDPELVEPLTEALEGVYETLIAGGALPRPEFPPGDDVGRGPRPR